MYAGPARLSQPIATTFEDLVTSTNFPATHRGHLRQAYRLESGKPRIVVSINAERSKVLQANIMTKYANAPKLQGHSHSACESSGGRNGELPLLDDEDEQTWSRNDVSGRPT